MFFVLDENHNLVEAYDKEGVLAVLAQAIADGSLSGITENSAFVSQLKCCVSGQANKVAFVTQAKFNELKESGSLLANCVYFVTDDTTADDIDKTLTELTDTVNGILNNVSDILQGKTTVPSASCLKGANRKYISYNAWGSLTLGNEFELGCVYALNYSYLTEQYAPYHYSGILVVPNYNGSRLLHLGAMLGKNYRLAMSIDKEASSVSVSIFDKDENAVTKGGLEIVKIAEFGF